MTTLISELETAVQNLLQKNIQLKQQLATLTEQHELLQLDVMEKEEQQNTDAARIKTLLETVQAGNN
ncbi:hypothetical protein ORJ04_05890 [Rheinheimera baltica]|uniref:DUF904 domain-containing protein n=1 Tax=Rheinheimera baltica TaxID=67576 RepID=A0ABT9HWH7_9GAMM|nr:hypothetical protein [Rheinheimera baltica]MDP5135478.1 hypothetical protein [Rheinheimera baltica]